VNLSGPEAAFAMGALAIAVAGLGVAPYRATLRPA
jgi:hypothetical protein